MGACASIKRKFKRNTPGGCDRELKPEEIQEIMATCHNQRDNLQIDVNNLKQENQKLIQEKNGLIQKNEELIQINKNLYMEIKNFKNIINSMPNEFKKNCIINKNNDFGNIGGNIDYNENILIKFVLLNTNKYFINTKISSKLYSDVFMELSSQLKNNSDYEFNKLQFVYEGNAITDYFLNDQPVSVLNPKEKITILIINSNNNNNK